MSQNFDFWTNKTPFGIFVEPEGYLGFLGDGQKFRNDGGSFDPDDPDGSLVKPYVDRLSKVCSFYSYVTDFGDVISSNGLRRTGFTAFTESYARIPPDRRKNIMLNIQEYWTLDVLDYPNYYATNERFPDNPSLTFGWGSDSGKYDPTNASGITYPSIQLWTNNPEVIAEFARQAAKGAEISPHLFPQGHPDGGLTPGTPGITVGVFKSASKMFWTDQAEYARSRGSDCIIQYAGFGATQLSSESVPHLGIRSTNATGDISWWRRGFWNPNLFDRFEYSKVKGALRDKIEASVACDLYGGSVYNWCANMDLGTVGGEYLVGDAQGRKAADHWHYAGDRLVAISNGLSAPASTGYDLDDLSYWAARGAPALMHEFYKYVDELATSESKPEYRKGLAMIVQLDSPVFPNSSRLAGGVLGSQKWGHMKDPEVAVEIDILGAFGATDANVPYMRKPDQVWVWSAVWSNNNQLFYWGGESGDTIQVFGQSDTLMRIGNLTARSQIEKRLFKRPVMTESEATLLNESNGFYFPTIPAIPGATPEQQREAQQAANQAKNEERIQWLEQNTLPNVYWDARAKRNANTWYSQGVTNNVRFWSAATGNCLPSPCVFDRSCPLAAYLNMNNDIYKNDVRVAYKKWVSEIHTRAIEKAHNRLKEIGFTPTVQKKKPALFADPNMQLGWLAYEAGYSGSTANEFRNRMLKAATPYTYISSGADVFGPANAYLPQKRYFDASYGLSSNVEVQVANGKTNPLYQVLPNGYQGGHYLPPISSRAVMFNSEYPWLGVFAHPATDDYCCGNAASYEEDPFGIFIDNRNSPDVIAEFARQAALGSSVAPHLFPELHPLGGLTPGSAQTTLGVMRRVGEKHWNDLSDYALVDVDSLYVTPKARYVVHYAGAPGFSKYGTLSAGVRRQANTTRRSYWERNSILSDFADIYNGGETSIDRTKSLHDAQELASGLAVSFYNTFPSAPEWAAGATSWFTDFSLGNRKSPTGESLSTDYSFSDTLYWQTKEHASTIGHYDRAIRQYGIADESNPPKFDAIVTPMWSYEGGEITETLWNAWSGGRKDPRLAAAIDAASLFAQRDQTNPIMRSPEAVWVWDAPHYYWINIPTRSTYTPPNRNDGAVGVAPTEWPNYSLYWEKRGTTSQPSLNGGFAGHTMWARNYLEKLLFGRPEYPNELLQLMQSDGISSGGAGNSSNINQFRGDIQARTGKWIFDNSLTDGWWVYSSETYRHAENRVWYDPNTGGSKLPSPCVLDQNSPLAPWLNFSSQIKTTDVVDALRHYVSDYGCQYVESFKDQIDRYFAP